MEGTGKFISAHKRGTCAVWKGQYKYMTLKKEWNLIVVSV